VILVDTGVWVDHLKAGDHALAEALTRGQVLGHPWVIGELALGGLTDRADVLQLLGQLPQAPTSTAAELLSFIEHHSLAGQGIGYVDVQLVASTLLAGDAELWTRDRKLDSAAKRLGIARSTAA
jgi:predicted nucleic acid-binding protein